MHVAADATEMLSSRTATNDQLLADSIRADGNVVLGFNFRFDGQGGRTSQQDTGYVSRPFSIGPNAYAMVRLEPQDSVNFAQSYLPPLDGIASAARGMGYVNIEPDQDSIVRMERMAVGFGDRYYAPLPLVAVAAYYKNFGISLHPDSNGVLGDYVGNREAPLDEGGEMMIRFRGGAGTFPTYSVSDVIRGKVPPNAFANKIVLIGATATGLEDLKPTPLETNEPGVEVQATVIDNILRGDFLVRSKFGLDEALFALALGLTTIVVSTYLSAIWAGLIEALLAATYILYTEYLIFSKHHIIGVFVPLFVTFITYACVSLYRYIAEGRDKRYLRTVLERYLHPQVIKALVDHPEQLRLGGVRSHLTIMFTDIVNFTTRAEKTDPEELVELLNDYMTAMTDLILEARGVVGRLMGDGILAFWGTPVEVPNAPRAAIDCGLAMLSRLDRLRREDPRFNNLYMGIGIHVGEVIVGNCGSARHFDYSIIGDAANFASRLEGLTRHFKVPLLVSAEALAEAGREAYLSREIGLVKVKGKSDLVEIVEVVGHREEFENDRAFYKAYAEALDLARAGSWQAALSSLRQLLEQRPTDEITKLCVDALARGSGLNQNHLIFEFDTK